VLPAAVQHVVCSIGGTDPFRSFGNTMTVGFSFGVDSPSSADDLEFLDRFYVEVRPVHYNPNNGNISSPKPTRCCGYTLEKTDRGSTAILLANAEEGSCSVHRSVHLGTTTGNYEGGLVAQLHVPSLPPLTVPYVPLAQRAVVPP
jgi:hypothetical protein